MGVLIRNQQFVERSDESKFESTQAYLNYPYTALFHPLDLEHAWIETDETGTMLASSYMYATTRD